MSLKNILTSCITDKQIAVLTTSKINTKLKQIHKSLRGSAISFVLPNKKKMHLKRRLTATNEKR